MDHGLALWWHCLCEEQEFTDEHYARLCLLTPTEMKSIIAELACSHPVASALLKNKWLTEPEKILARVSEEYDERTREQQNFRTDSDADCWLRELYRAVLEPLTNVPAVQLEQAEAFILKLFTDEERLADITCRGDGWTWHFHLENTLIRIVLKGIIFGSEYFRQRLHDITIEPSITYENIVSWIRYLPDDEQKMVRNVLAK